MLLKLLALFSSLALAAAGNVLVFTDADFDAKISQYPLILVKFYAPWCGHCKRLAPHFEEAAGKLSELDPPLHLAKVDCTTEKEVCSKFDVSGYPTLKVFKNGALAFDYDGPRDTDGIVDYMIGKSVPSSKELKTEEDLKKTLDRQVPVFLTYVKTEDDVLLTAQKSAGDEFSGKIAFAHTMNPALLGASGDKRIARLYLPSHLRNKFEDEFKVFEGEPTATDLKKWITDHAFGICGHRTGKNLQFFNKHDLIVFYHNINYQRDPKGSAYWRNRVLKTIKLRERSKNVKFAISDAKEFSHELSQFGLENAADHLPIVAVISEKGKKFQKTKTSWEDLDKFIVDYEGGKLEPFIKSEDVPGEQKDHVKKVVAKTFDEIVNDPSKDVFIEFFAPWCGHCRSLKPKYESLAEKLAKEPNVVIAAMDATANDVPSSFNVEGFPTLYFVPKNKKSNPIPYNGEREVDALLKFVAKSATDELSYFNRDGRAKKSEL